MKYYKVYSGYYIQADTFTDAQIIIANDSIIENHLIIEQVDKSEAKRKGIYNE